MGRGHGEVEHVLYIAVVYGHVDSCLEILVSFDDKVVNSIREIADEEVTLGIRFGFGNGFATLVKSEDSAFEGRPVRTAYHAALDASGEFLGGKSEGAEDCKYCHYKSFHIFHYLLLTTI